MEGEDRYDWLGFWLNFLFAALPTWSLVGIGIWKISPYTEGSTIFLISSGASILAGIAAGIWKAGFWNNATKIASFSPYTNRKKK